MEPFNGARAALAIACFLPSMGIASSEMITETDAIRLFLAESPRVRDVSLATRAMDAEMRIDARATNPSVAYQIEDAGGVRDEFLTFEQELAITGRRELLRERADAASAAAGFAAERDLREDAHALRLSFYEVLYLEAVVESRRRGEENLVRTVVILRDREHEGEGAGYDVLRAEQELAELRIAARRAEAALAEARSELGSYFDAARGMDDAPLSGDFTARHELPGVDEAVVLALSSRLDLRALSAHAERQDLEYKAARRRRFPEPTVAAGWKRVEAAGSSDTGFAASLRVPLPLFDRGRYEAARATADRERASVEVEILKRRIRAEVQAAVTRARTAREAARSYGQQIERRAGELRRIVRLGYDEGESGILELLDAHRTASAMELRALAARYEAKAAEIELDRVLGIEVRP